MRESEGFLDSVGRGQWKPTVRHLSSTCLMLASILLRKKTPVSKKMRTFVGRLPATYHNAQCLPYVLFSYFRNIRIVPRYDKLLPVLPAFATSVLAVGSFLDFISRSFVPVGIFLQNSTYT